MAGQFKRSIVFQPFCCRSAAVLRSFAKANYNYSQALAVGQASHILRYTDFIEGLMAKRFQGAVDVKQVTSSPTVGMRCADMLCLVYAKCGRVQMHFCKPWPGCLLFLEKRLSPGSPSKQAILVQSVSNCVVMNFNI